MQQLVSEYAKCSLVDMYTKCDLAEKAQEVFDKLPFQNVVSWNALISGYIESGDNEWALKCFEEMQLEGLLPDIVTFVFTMNVCGNVGAISKGTEIHAAITRKGSLASSTRGMFSLRCATWAGVRSLSKFIFSPLNALLLEKLDSCGRDSCEWGQLRNVIECLCVFMQA